METNENMKSQLAKQAEAEIEEMVRQLQELEEGDLEGLEQEILSRVLQIGKRWLQGILQAQAEQSAKKGVLEGVCGHLLHLVGKRPRQIVSVFGEVEVRRNYYHCAQPKKEAKTNEEREEHQKCRPGVVPFDRMWGVTSQRSSPGVQRLVSFFSARLTHEEVAQTLARVLPVSLSARQVGNILQPVGEAFEQEEERQMQDLLAQAACKQTTQAEQRAEIGEPIGHFYVEADGVMVRHRRGSVPMVDEERTRPGDVYREVKVGAVFVGQAGRERSELVPGVFVDAAGPKRYVARRTTAEDFGRRLYALAHAAGVQRADEVIVLGDGAKWIWNLAEEHFPGAVQIVDEYHAREHVWHVAHAAFPVQEEQREAWAKAVCDDLAHGKVEQVIAAIESLPPLAPPPGKTHGLLEIEAEYFRTNAERMRYLTFRSKGMHIGSGIAEAGCKTVVSTRAKQSGMRWTPDGLHALLAVRTAVLNQEFDQLWHASREAA